MLEVWMCCSKEGGHAYTDHPAGHCTSSSCHGGLHSYLCHPRNSLPHPATAPGLSRDPGEKLYEHHGHGAHMVRYAWSSLSISVYLVTPVSLFLQSQELPGHSHSVCQTARCLWANQESGGVGREQHRSIAVPFIITGVVSCVCLCCSGYTVITPHA